MQKSQLKGSSNSKYLDSFTIQNHSRDNPPRHFKKCLQTAANAFSFSSPIASKVSIQDMRI